MDAVVKRAAVIEDDAIAVSPYDVAARAPRSPHAWMAQVLLDLCKAVRTKLGWGPVLPREIHMRRVLAHLCRPRYGPDLVPVR